MIYFIQCGDRIKIGHSAKPKMRFNKIASDAPMPCKMLGVIEGGLDVEREVHQNFANQRVHGEWFLTSDRLFRFIDANATMPEDKRAASEHSILCGIKVKRGDKSRIAKALGFRNSAVTHWKAFPPEHCTVISSVLGIPRHQLRPDIFGHEKGIAA